MGNAQARSKALLVGGMKRNTKENGKMENKMEKESRRGQLETNTKENGKMG